MLLRLLTHVVTCFIFINISSSLDAPPECVLPIGFDRVRWILLKSNSKFVDIRDKEKEFFPRANLFLFSPANPAKQRRL